MKIVVSLTTIFDRQRQCARMLKSMLQQTHAPDEIRLYVSSTPYLLDKGIQPYCLEPALYEITQAHKQIVVEWVKNQGPYRKLLPALQKYWQQDMLLITCDDDVEYIPTFIETCIDLYQQKKCCIAFQGTRMNKSFDYNSFEEANDTQSLWNLPKGVGGVVYNPLWFSNNAIFDMDSKWKNDDLWFVAWRIAAGIECYITPKGSARISMPTKATLWGAYNETSNTVFLKEIFQLCRQKGWISVEIP